MTEATEARGATGFAETESCCSRRSRALEAACTSAAWEASSSIRCRISSDVSSNTCHKHTCQRVLHVSCVTCVSHVSSNTCQTHIACNETPVARTPVARQVRPLQQHTRNRSTNALHQHTCNRHTRHEHTHTSTHTPASQGWSALTQSTSQD